MKMQSLENRNSTRKKHNINPLNPKPLDMFSFELNDMEYEEPEKNSIKMQYPYSLENRKYDGKEHNITPFSLFSFELNGKKYYWLEYYDESLDEDMATLLTRDITGNFFKRPLDNYDNMEKLLNNVELSKENTYQLTQNIKLGETIIFDNLINNDIEKTIETTLNRDIKTKGYNLSNIRVFKAPGNSNHYYAVDEVNQSINLFERKPNGEINRLFIYLDYNSNRDVLNYEEVNPSIIGVESNELRTLRMDWQALFRVYRTNRGLEVDRTTYDNYLEQYIGNKNPNRDIGRERVSITQDEIDYIVQNSHEPNLKPDYINELSMSNSFGGNGNGGDGNGGNGIPNKDVIVMFIVYVTDYCMFVDRTTYDNYLEQYIGNKNPNRDIGRERVSITQEEIDYIVKVSKFPHLEPEYKYELTHDNNNNNNFIMDYPNMNDFFELPFNQLWDGTTHSINPVDLFKFELNGRIFYFMNYYDNNYNCECITLLEENELGEIVKIPLDNYDKVEELLSKVKLNRVDIKVLPNHIHLGKLLEIDNFINTHKLKVDESIETQETFDDKFGIDKFLISRYGFEGDLADLEVTIMKNYLIAYREYLKTIKISNSEANNYIAENLKATEEAIDDIENQRLFL